MKHIILLIVILSSAFFSASAQVCLCKDSGAGICTDTAVSEERIIEIFGKPKQIWTEEGEAIEGLMKTYVYENLRIAVVNGFLFDFSFSNRDRNRDCFVEVDDKYRLKLADNFLSFVQSIPASEVMVRNYEENVMQLFFKTDDGTTFSDSSLLVTLDPQGLVTRISWVSPV